MTRNRTAVDLLSALGAELTVLLLFVLAGSLAISRYFAGVRERLHQAEVKVRRRAARGRRTAA